MSTPTFVTAARAAHPGAGRGRPSEPTCAAVARHRPQPEDWGPQFVRPGGAHRVIALDLPGSGFSDRMPEPTTLEVLGRGWSRPSTYSASDGLCMPSATHSAVRSPCSWFVSAPERVASLVLGQQQRASALRSRCCFACLARPGAEGEFIAVRRTTRSSAGLTLNASVRGPALATRRASTRAGHRRAARPGAVLLEIARHLGTRRGSRRLARELTRSATGTPGPRSWSGATRTASSHIIWTPPSDSSPTPRLSCSRHRPHAPDRVPTSSPPAL